MNHVQTQRRTSTKRCELFVVPDTANNGGEQRCSGQDLELLQGHLALMASGANYVSSGVGGVH